MSRHPEQRGFNYSKIPTLAEQAVNGRRGRSEQAQVELTTRVGEDPNFDSAIIALYEIGKQSLSGRSPSAPQIGIALLKSIISQAGDGETTSGRKNLNLSPEVILAAKGIAINDRRLRQDPKFAGILPENYSNLVGKLPEWIKKASQKGETYIEIGFARRARPGENLDNRALLLDQYQQWADRMANFFAEGLVIRPADYKNRDKLVDILREEPEQDLYPERRLFSSPFGNTTLEEITAMELPITEADFSKYLDYLNGLLSSSPSVRKQEIIRELFFSTVYYRDTGGDMQYRNYDFFSRLSYLQEKLILVLISESPDLTMDQKAAEIFNKISHDQILTFLVAATEWITRPQQLDPKQQRSENEGIHKLYGQAISDYLTKHPSPAPFVYGDEITRDYFEQNILPLIENRLKQSASNQAIEQALPLFKELLGKVPFELEHLTLVTEYFLQRLGGEMLKKLDTKASEIKEVTQINWDSIIKRGIHSLPLATGEDKIIFSKESLPHLLGLNSVSFHLTEISEDWQVLVVFDIEGSSLRILSRLDSDGNLSFRAPLEKTIPGMVAVLRHIAVITFRDLVVQKQREGANPKAKTDFHTRKSNVKITERNISDLSPLNHYNLPTESTITSLPRRIQSEESLIKDASSGAKYTPHPVRIHGMWLPGARAYHEAYLQYQQVQEEGASQFTLDLLGENLEELRKKMYRADPAKISTFPAHLEQVALTDPNTEKVIYLKTWVCEHLSPTMTDEEKRSPLQQFKKYYSDSSALASLEPLKIWLFETA